MQLKRKLLLLEDDAHIRTMIRQCLSDQEWEIAEVITVAEAIAVAAAVEPDLVIMDLGLPDGDGKKFLRNFRTGSNATVMVLTARGQEQEKVFALDAGADDYLTKPFSVAELQARIRAHLRRSTAASQEAASHYQFGDIEVDLQMRRVSRAGQAVHLTPKEFDLLSLLLVNAGKVVTQRRMMVEIWGPAFLDQTHYLRIYMGHLRHKLEQDPARPRFILTETGVGYRLEL
ncbi:MAG TPA: response regulator [Advenella sp.]|nr:response regulator [Advenella sp.]